MLHKELSARAICLHYRLTLRSLPQAPIQLLLTITCPVVDYDSENDNWNRHLTALQLLLGPMFAVFATDQYSTSIWPINFTALTVPLPTYELSFFCRSDAGRRVSTLGSIPYRLPGAGSSGFLVFAEQDTASMASCRYPAMVDTAHTPLW